MLKMYKYLDLNNADRNARPICYISGGFLGQLVSTHSILLINTQLPRGIVPSHRDFWQGLSRTGKRCCQHD